VDHHLLSFESRVEVGNDADAPARRVRLATFGRQRKDLGRSAVFTVLAEGTALELLRCLGLDLGAACSRTPGSRWGERDESPR
jgi:hypothetical protein